MAERKKTSGAQKTASRKPSAASGRDSAAAKRKSAASKSKSASQARKKPMTKAMAAEFLKSGRVHAKGLYSSRTGKTFDADIVLDTKTDPDRGQMISYRLEFPDTGGKRKPAHEK